MSQGFQREQRPSEGPTVLHIRFVAYLRVPGSS